MPNRKLGLAAAAALLMIGTSCQKNGESELQPASGVNPDYYNRGYMQQEEQAPESAPSEQYPTRESAPAAPNSDLPPSEFGTETEPDYGTVPEGTQMPDAEPTDPRQSPSQSPDDGSTWGTESEEGDSVDPGSPRE